MKKRILSIVLTVAVLCGMYIQPVAALTPTQDQAIKDQIASMTLEQKIGQMMMLDIRQWKLEGGTLQDLTVMNDDIRSMIDKYDLGGVILFANNVKATAQTATLVNDLQQIIVDDASNKLPLFVTIDQEGGIVTRLGTGTNLPGNMALGATFNPDYAYQAGKVIGEELNALGFNVDFAPSVDVNNNAANPVIGVRSFGEDPVAVGNMGIQMIKGIAEQNVGVTAKHFPGHGDTGTDSHFGLPVVNKSKEELMKTELVPFKMAIAAGVDMIMTAHVALPQIENEVVNTSTGPMPLPSTLSDDVINGLLRTDLGYKGVVITDAMNMEGISANFTESAAAIKSINAGVDIQLMPTIIRSNADLPKLDKLFADVKAAVISGEIPLTRIDESVYRILKLKVDRGIWKPGQPLTLMPLADRLALANAVVGSPAHRETEAKVSDAAVTLVKNDRSLLPLNLKPGQTLLVITPTKAQLDAIKSEISRLRKLGQLGDFNITEQLYTSAIGHVSANTALQDKIKAADYVLFASDSSTTSILNPASYMQYFGTEVIDYAHANNKKTVLVSLRNPYDGAVLSKADAHLAVYGNKGNPNGPDSEASMSASPASNLPAGVRAIFGVTTPVGQLPVSMPKNVDGSFSKTDFYRALAYGIKNFTPLARFEPKDDAYENLMYDETVKLEIAIGQDLTEDSVGFYVDVNGTLVNGDIKTGDITILEGAAKYEVIGDVINYYSDATATTPSRVYNIGTGRVYENGVLIGTIDPATKAKIDDKGKVILTFEVQPLPTFAITEKFVDSKGNVIVSGSKTELKLDDDYAKEALVIKNWVLSSYSIDGTVLTGTKAEIAKVDANHEVIFVYKADLNNNGIADEDETKPVVPTNPTTPSTRDTTTVGIFVTMILVSGAVLILIKKRKEAK